MYGQSAAAERAERSINDESFLNLSSASNWDAERAKMPIKEPNNEYNFSDHEHVMNEINA